MLRPPSRPARNLLDLANLIEDVDPSAFDMRHWCACICGHYMRSIGREDHGNYQKASELLGISDEMGRELFGCDSPKEAYVMLHRPREAAERIRSFAFALVD